ncbi:MAG: IS3 family transposase [Bacillota bacterium]|nr:IS3 family transposase [Bacillota bacterium]
MIEIPASDKYAIIKQMIERPDNKLSIAALCEMARVSRSGFYSYLDTADARAKREEDDLSAFNRILEAYSYRGYPKGAKRIYMHFLHMDPPILMNLKKIRRLMAKYSLRCPVRRSNPYRRMARAFEMASVAPDLVQREFEGRGPRKVLLTDITYLINGVAPRCYLVTILDACTREVLSWQLSASLEVDFVLAAVHELLEKHKVALSTQTILHSDQGAHFKSVRFVRLLEDHELRRSMSRKANCWDNAPQESFFGHMKDEIDISDCRNFASIHAVIADWMDYYNHERYQWNLAKLAPAEYYHYICTGRYPLLIPPPQGISRRERDNCE